jgi:hypothetical protein
LVDDGDASAEAFDNFEDVRGQEDGRALGDLLLQDLFHQP